MAKLRSYPGGLHAVSVACVLAGAAAPPAAAQIRFSTPIYQVGQFEAPGEQVFGEFVTPALAPSGDLYLGDWSTGQIRHFDAHGRFVAAFGRKGQGPGEFAALTSIAVAPRGDSLFVYDEVQNRVSVFTTAGRLGRSFRVPARPAKGMKMAFHPAGYLLFTGQTEGSPFLVHVVARNGRGVRSFARMLTPADLSSVRYQREAVRRQLNQGFVTALPGGDVLVLLEAPYRVGRFALDGTPRWVVNDAALGNPLGSMLFTRTRYKMGLYSATTALHVLGPDRFVVVYADFEHERRGYDVRSAADGRLLLRRSLPFRSHLSALLPGGAAQGLALITDEEPYNRFYLSRWELH